MQEKLRYSIIIPVLNRANFLNDLLCSISKIQHNSFEVVFVDNGSTDNSYEILQHFANMQHKFRVKLLRCVQTGTCAARNAGFDASDGEYVYFFDSDDVISPDYFRHVDKCLPADVVVCDTTLQHPDGSLSIRSFPKSNEPHNHILNGSLSTQSFCVNRYFFKKIGGWNERLCRWNDYELGARIMLTTPHIKWLKTKPFHVIRIHEDSITGSSFSKDIECLLQSLATVHNDINTLSKNRSIAKKCLLALYGKYNILKLHLLRESALYEARMVDTAVRDVVCSGTKFRLIVVICRLWAILKLPGLWRILYLII